MKNPSISLFLSMAVGLILTSCFVHTSPPPQTIVVANPEPNPDPNVSFEEVEAPSKETPAPVTPVEPEVVAEGNTCENNPNETLSTADVKDSMSNVRSSVNACFSKFSITGKVTVRVSVGCMGSVQSASASGEHASSPVGGCIEKAVRGAKFPKFKAPSSRSFQYPFVGGG